MSINSMNKSFYISFCFNLDETFESYKWALDQNKELYSLLSLPAYIIVGPSAINIDCDYALLKAIPQVFPNSKALLCAWHANKNV